MNAQTKNEKTLTTTPINMPSNAEFKFFIDEGIIFLFIFIIIYSFLTKLYLFFYKHCRYYQ